MITYKDIDFSEIHTIKHLWESNRAYHEETSEFFAKAYHGLIFEERIAGFSTYASEDILISVAYDDDKAIGYCLTVKSDLKGELATLHVLPSHRGLGIGKKMVGDHLKWLEDSACDNISVVVSQENASTIAFYKSFGFYPNTLEMHKK